MERGSREGGSESRMDEGYGEETPEVNAMDESVMRREMTIKETESLVRQKGYLKNIPDALGEGEYERELEERKDRRRNIFVWGIRTVEGGIKELREIIRKKTGVTIYIKKLGR